jgi:uncharacterized protein (DUF433 family)
VRLIRKVCGSSFKINVILKFMVETIETNLITKKSDGTYRIGKTRVSLDSVVHHFKLGATAEEIAQKFPALILAEVYSAIAFYLSNQEEVETYLRSQENEADLVQAEIEVKFRDKTNELRERILSRQVSLKP